MAELSGRRRVMRAPRRRSPKDLDRQHRRSCKREKVSRHCAAVNGQRRAVVVLAEGGCRVAVMTGLSRSGWDGGHRPRARSGGSLPFVAELVQPLAIGTVDGNPRPGGLRLRGVGFPRLIQRLVGLNRQDTRGPPAGKTDGFCCGSLLVATPRAHCVCAHRPAHRVLGDRSKLFGRCNFAAGNSSSYMSKPLARPVSALRTGLLTKAAVA